MKCVVKATGIDWVLVVFERGGGKGLSLASGLIKVNQIFPFYILYSWYLNHVTLGNAFCVRVCSA